MVSKTIGAAQKTWLGAIQRRVAITSSILGSMKSVRMLGIEDVLSTTIQNLRVRELVFAAKFRRHSIWRNMISEYGRSNFENSQLTIQCNSHPWPALLLRSSSSSFKVPSKARLVSLSSKLSLQ